MFRIPRTQNGVPTVPLDICIIVFFYMTAHIPIIDRQHVEIVKEVYLLFRFLFSYLPSYILNSHIFKKTSASAHSLPSPLSPRGRGSIAALYKRLNITPYPTTSVSIQRTQAPRSHSTTNRNLYKMSYHQSSSRSHHGSVFPRSSMAYPGSSIQDQHLDPNAYLPMHDMTAPMSSYSNSRLQNHSQQVPLTLPSSYYTKSQSEAPPSSLFDYNTGDYSTNTLQTRICMFFSSS